MCLLQFVGYTYVLTLYCIAVKYVPEWVPGATFKKKARYWRELMPRFVDAPFDTAKKAIVRIF